MRKALLKSIVYTSGVFDLFHAGHLQALELAKKHGDVLIVGVHSDEDSESYKRLPFIPFEQRTRVLQGLAVVDEVVRGPLFETEVFYRALNVDVHCQGNEIDGFYETAKHLGILRILGRSDLNETTKIMQDVMKRCGAHAHFAWNKTTN